MLGSHKVKIRGFFCICAPCACAILLPTCKGMWLNVTGLSIHLSCAEHVGIVILCLLYLLSNGVSVQWLKILTDRSMIPQLLCACLPLASSCVLLRPSLWTTHDTWDCHIPRQTWPACARSVCLFARSYLSASWSPTCTPQGRKVRQRARLSSWKHWQSMLKWKAGLNAFKPWSASSQGFADFLSQASNIKIKYWIFPRLDTCNSLCALAPFRRVCRLTLKDSTMFYTSKGGKIKGRA